MHQITAYLLKRDANLNWGIKEIFISIKMLTIILKKWGSCSGSTKKSFVGGIGQNAFLRGQKSKYSLEMANFPFFLTDGKCSG